MNSSDETKRDMEMLCTLIANESMMLADADIMYSTLRKYNWFTKEFHLRKKLPVQEKEIPFTMAFTFIQRAENLGLPNQRYQEFHVFDSKPVQITNDKG